MSKLRIGTLLVAVFSLSLLSSPRATAMRSAQSCFDGQGDVYYGTTNLDGCTFLVNYMDECGNDLGYQCYEEAWVPTSCP